MISPATTSPLQQNIRQMVTAIDAELATLAARQKQLTQAKTNLQAVCNHLFEPSERFGGDYEQCQHCGFEQRAY